MHFSDFFERYCIPKPLFILTFGLLLTISCDRTPARRPPIDKIDVVATAYPLATLAQAVGGPVVNVQWFIESGQTLRGLGRDSRDRVAAARIVLFNSRITEPWIAADASLALGGERLLPLSQLSEAREASASGWLWLDPIIIRAAAVELHHRLLALRAGQAAILSDRTDAFVAEIDALVNEYQPRFTASAGRKILVLGHDLDPFVSRLTLTPETVLDRPASELSDADFDSIRYAVKDRVPALMLIDDGTPAAIRERLTRAGCRLISIDPLGSSAALGRNNYLALMRFDYDALLEGMK